MLPKLVSQQKDTILKVSKVAHSRDKKLQEKGLMIVKAYYGKKSDIVKFSDLKMLPDG